MTAKKVIKRQSKTVSSADESGFSAPDNEPIATEYIDIQDSPTATEESSSPDQPGYPPIQQIGRIQGYWIATMKVFADCAVQKSQEGVFDVLARNFETSGALSWWLWRIGHGEKCRLTKRRDIVDAIRKVSAELHRDLSGDIGRPVARW